MFFLGLLSLNCLQLKTTLRSKGHILELYTLNPFESYTEGYDLGFQPCSYSCPEHEWYPGSPGPTGEHTQCGHKERYTTALISIRNIDLALYIAVLLLCPIPSLPTSQKSLGSHSYLGVQTLSSRSRVGKGFLQGPRKLIF